MKQKLMIAVLVLLIGVVIAAMVYFSKYIKPSDESNTDIKSRSRDIPAINSKVDSDSSEEKSTEQSIYEKSEEVSEKSSENSEASATESSDEPSEASADTSSDTSSEPTYLTDISKYLKYIEPEDDTPFVFLVNKENLLSSDFVPTNLVTSSFAREGREENCKLVETAAMALEAFLKEATAAGYGDVTVTNAYRSYSYQSWLYYTYYFNQEQGKHKSYSKEQILGIVASYCFPPGTSEHQTGLCLDMYNVEVGKQDDFSHTEAADWLEENAWKFGFILRYPEGKEDITLCTYESWHFRFVGRKVATFIHENGWCLEEYFDSIS